MLQLFLKLPFYSMISATLSWRIAARAGPGGSLQRKVQVPEEIMVVIQKMAFLPPHWCVIYSLRHWHSRSSRPFLHCIILCEKYFKFQYWHFRVPDTDRFSETLGHFLLKVCVWQVSCRFAIFLFAVTLKSLVIERIILVPKCPSKLKLRGGIQLLHLCFMPFWCWSNAREVRRTSCLHGRCSEV